MKRATGVISAIGKGLFAHRGKFPVLFLTILFSWLLLLPLIEPPATAMGSRPHAIPASPTAAPNTPEGLLVQVLLEIQNTRLDAAMQHLESLLHLRPNFRLAHLIKGDLLMARARPISALGDAPDMRVLDFREEARVRLKHYLEPVPQERLPEPLLQLDPTQTHAVVVDIRRSRLYVFRNEAGSPHYVADYYVTVGKGGADKRREGDQRTPLGVYFVVDELPANNLSDFYGGGAFPINYPNEWDRRLGRSGSGIWLHGVPSDTYSRPPRASNGCVVLSNEDLDALRRYVILGRTPVVIGDGVKWVDPAGLRLERDTLQREIERWRRDWESLDLDRYLAHYSPAFHNDKQDFTAWASQKRRVNAAKTHVEVRLSNVSMLRYPSEENLIVVTFDQEYRSNNLQNKMRKRQYWRQEHGAWKIVYEGSA